MAFLSMLMIFKVFVALIAVRLMKIVAEVYKAVVVTPARLRSELRKRGIDGPPPSLLVGNVREIKKARAEAIRSDDEQESTATVSHNCDSLLFPFLHRWTQQYGPTFVFSLGPMQILHIGSTDVVKEITTCTSLDLGKPSRQQQVFAPLLGQGILTSNGPIWAHHRKVLAPQLYMDRVKGMVKFMAESSLNLIELWKNKVEHCSGGVVEIKIDEYMRSFSGDVISKACFGSNFSKGQEIFGKLRELQEAMSKRGLSSNLPILRSLPTKSNREVWRLEKEVRELILKVAKEREEEAEPGQDLLQTILETARSDKLGNEAMERFIVDNCKNIYLAGYETTAVAATWTLMLLAINPDWQERVRAEVLQLCRSGTLDFDMIRHMKKLTMVINESLRLYPPVSVISREALEDLKLGHLEVPKGANLWAVTVTLHQDPEIWGPDSAEFNPERFVNGVNGACKLPHVYMPFGAGPRTCLGQNFAMVELKILLSRLLLNFSFSLSKIYKHQPTLNLVTEPQFGVHLLVKKLLD